jgi:hypothetical protein
VSATASQGSERAGAQNLADPSTAAEPISPAEARSPAEPAPRVHHSVL